MVASPERRVRSDARPVLVAVPALDRNDPVTVAVAEDAELDRVLTRGGLRSAYQPIVELHSNATVGY